MKIKKTSPPPRAGFSDPTLPLNIPLSSFNPPPADEKLDPPLIMSITWHT